MWQKSMEKAAISFKDFVTDKCGVCLMYFWTKFGVSVVRRVGNTVEHKKAT